MEQSTLPAEQRDPNRALTNLLSTFSVESKRRLLAAHGISFDGAYYAVIILGVYDLPGRGTALPDEVLISTQDLLRRYTEASLQSLCTAYFVVPDFYGKALFLAFPEAAEIDKQIKAVQAAMVQALRTLAADHHIWGYCSLSLPVDSLEALPLAYQQAEELAITHRNTYTPACYLAGQSVASGQEHIFLDVQRQLMNLLSSRRFMEIPTYLSQQHKSGAVEIADLMHVQRLLESYIPMYMSAHHAGVHDVYSAVMKQLSRLRGHFYIRFDRRVWHQDLCTLFQILTDTQAQKDGPSLQNTGAKITTYLVEHPFDPDLNLNQMAELFGLSASYVSRAFKQYTGVTIIDFITNLRLNRAKELLRETDESIQEIAQAVGYTPNTLARIFRSNENMSPSQYRSENQCTLSP